MSGTSSHLSAVFDLQRNAFEQTHDAVKRSVETQQELGEAFVDFGPAKQANERSYEAVHTGVDAYLDAVESATPGQQDLLGEFRATVDEQLDALEATQVEAIESVEANVQDGSVAADELLEEFLAALDEQFEAVLKAHEAVEDQTAELQRQLEEVTETAQQQVAVQLEATGESLEAIDGLGSTYADRLQEQGIESFEALTEATVETVAEVAEVSEQQAEEWIEAAQSQA